MKVLMLGWELPPHNSGGLGVACYQLCQSLSRHDIDMEFVLPYHSDEKPGFMKLTAAQPIGVLGGIKERYCLLIATNIATTMVTKSIMICTPR